MNYLIIINEQHSLLPTQKQQIEEKFGQIKEKNIVKVPASGWTLDEMNVKIREWLNMPVTLIFISPIPYLIRELSKNGQRVLLFHNDKREKTETPDGKIFYRLSQDGWQLV